MKQSDRNQEIACYRTWTPKAFGLHSFCTVCSKISAYFLARLHKLVHDYRIKTPNDAKKSFGCQIISINPLIELIAVSSLMFSSRIAIIVQRRVVRKPALLLIYDSAAAVPSSLARVALFGVLD